jgi:release factor glutamine methyltransferase
VNREELLRATTEKISAAKDVDNASLEARWILDRALGASSEPDSSQIKFIEKAVQERIEGRPLAYILGEKEFYGINFHVDSNVLIPRPESEHLVEQACVFLKEASLPSPRVLDLGAGSGCIGLAIAKKIPEVKLCSVDTSVEALDVVDFNRKSLGLEDRVQLLTMDVDTMGANDLPDFFQGHADIITANPPYLAEGDPLVAENVRLHEPRIALFADENGMGAIRRWAQVAGQLISPNGLVLFEIGHDQGTAAKDLFTSLEIFSSVEVLKDYSGCDRVIKARRS